MVPISPEELKERVRGATDIVQFIGESLTLHRKGHKFYGLCPFHDDHDPSMEVNPERQSWRCWVCQEGGDVFSFVMKQENVGFREALEQLAERARIEIPKSFRPGTSELPTLEKTDLFSVLRWAEQECHTFLRTAAEANPARDYLESRSFSEAMIDRFRLGYHPNQWDWLLNRARGKFSNEQLLAAKLIAERDNGRGFYDLHIFIDRLIFPIHDERGRTISFGGRVLPGGDDSRGKYQNGVDSPLFSKSRTCYGLAAARDGIKEQGVAIVTEGYADCIKCHQFGVTNTVATLGTALTETHVSILKRFTRKVVLVFDGDRAGRENAERSLPRFLAQEVDLRILTLPDDLDPDEFLEAQGAEAFRQLAAAAPEAFQYKLQVLVDRHGTASTDARLRILEEMLELVRQTPRLEGTPREGLLLMKLHERLGVAEADIRQQLRKLRQQVATTSVNSRKPATDSSTAGNPQDWTTAAVSLQRSQKKDDLLECELLQILLTRPDRIDWVRQHVGVEDFQQPAAREIFGVMLDLCEQGTHPTFDALLSRLEASSLKGLLVWIDDQAQRLDVARKLEVDFGQEGGDSPQDLLSWVLYQLQFRREQNHQQARRGLLAAQPEQSAGLNPVTRELLLKAHQFHSKRAVK